jgi:hypothetical protein
MRKKMNYPNNTENMIDKIRDEIDTLSFLSQAPKNEVVIAMKMLASSLVEDLNEMLKNIRYQKE